MQTTTPNLVVTTQIMQGEPHTDPRMLEMSDWGGHIDPHDLQLS